MKSCHPIQVCIKRTLCPLRCSHAAAAATCRLAPCAAGAAGWRHQHWRQAARKSSAAADPSRQEPPIGGCACSCSMQPCQCTYVWLNPQLPASSSISAHALQRQSTTTAALLMSTAPGSIHLPPISRWRRGCLPAPRPAHLALPRSRPSSTVRLSWSERR